MKEWKASRKDKHRESSSSSILDDPFVRRLFEGLDEADLVWLLSPKINDCLYEFDLKTKSVHRLSIELVPWPVLFLLRRRHRKFRFVSNSIPTFRHLHDALTDASTKIKWRHFFASKDETRVLPPRSMIYKKRVASCSGPRDAQIDSLCDQIRSSFTNAAIDSISRSYRRKKTLSNICPIDRAAHAWLLHSRFTAVPCDKEIGFCLVDLDEFVANQLCILQSSWYQETSLQWISVQAWTNCIVPGYLRICRDVCANDSRISMSMLTSSLYFGRERIASCLMHTVKTHKPPGGVVFRPVHASSNHPFTGLMCWINLVTETALLKHKHILRSCDDFIKGLREFKKPDGDTVWVHFDLKDFFMQGDVAFLVRHCSLMVAPAIRPAFRAALKFVLTNQFVRSRLIPGRLWKVMSGTGIGLKCSSNVADLAFLHAVELQGLGLAIRRVQQRLGVLHYVRYRDNLLFCWRPNFVVIKQTLKKLEEAHPYTGSVEEASNIGVAFLDLQFFYDVSTNAMAFSPLLKDSALASILNFHSAHPQSVHGSWLKAYMYRLRNRSSSVEWFLAYKQEVLNRLAKFGVDRTVLSVLDRETTFTYPINRLQPRPRQKKDDILRVVLPYHPLWAKAFGPACRSLSQELKNIDAPGLSTLSGIAVSWKLQGQSMAQMICKY